MPDLSRRAALTAIGSLTVPGCVRGPGTENTAGEPNTNQTPTETSSPTDETPAGNGITPASNKPNPDHAIYLSNEGSREQTIHVQVVRKATDDIAFEETRTISPETEREIYNLKQVDPDGIEAFTICGQLVAPTPTSVETATATSELARTSETPDSPHRDCVTMRTNECYGTAYVTVQDSGELHATYSVC